MISDELFTKLHKRLRRHGEDPQGILTPRNTPRQVVSGLSASPCQPSSHGPVARKQHISRAAEKNANGDKMGGAVGSMTNGLCDEPDHEARVVSHQHKYKEVIQSRQSRETLAIAQNIEFGADVGRPQVDVTEFGHERVATQSELQKFSTACCNDKNQKRTPQGNPVQDNLQLQATENQKQIPTVEMENQAFIEKIQSLEREVAHHIVSRNRLEKALRAAHSREAELQRLLSNASLETNISAYSLHESDNEGETQDEQHDGSLQFIYEGLDACKAMSIDQYLNLAEQSTASTSVLDEEDPLDSDQCEETDQLTGFAHLENLEEQTKFDLLEDAPGSVGTPAVPTGQTEKLQELAIFKSDRLQRPCIGSLAEDKGHIKPLTECRMHRAAVGCGLFSCFCFFSPVIACLGCIPVLIPVAGQNVPNRRQFLRKKATSLFNVSYRTRE